MTTVTINYPLATNTQFQVWNTISSSTKREKSRTDFTDYRGNAVAPRTQKARGVLALYKSGVYVTPLTLVVQDQDTIDYLYNSLRRDTYTGSKIFARPCPVQPRHGFVDSRIVNSPDEARAVFKQAIAADPDAEMLLAQAIDSKWNAIWLPGQLVIGPGNDGATSGRHSFTVPLVTGAEPQALKLLAQQAGIETPNVPYIEIVIDKQNQYPLYTQVRGGPPISGGNGIDFIPHNMQVRHVITAKGDLMEWESRAKRFKPDTVVWHPGGSMASHYAVHCVLNNIPLLISKKPRIGNRLVPTDTRPSINMQAILKGIGAGTALNLNKENLRPAAVAAMLTGLHNVLAFSGEDGFWLGTATVLMQRLGAVALLGEARHAGNYTGLGRDGIYKQGLNAPFQTRRKLRRAQWMFHNYAFRSGYGGQPWANCGTALLNLDEAIRSFVVHPDTEHYTPLVAALNQAVNQAHNSGWWLNKFCVEQLMNEAAQADPRAAISGIAAFGALRAVSQSAIDEALAYWEITHTIPQPEPEPYAALIAQPSVMATSICSYCVHSYGTHSNGLMGPCNHNNCGCTHFHAHNVKSASAPIDIDQPCTFCNHAWLSHSKGNYGPCANSAIKCSCPHFNYIDPDTLPVLLPSLHIDLAAAEEPVINKPHKLHAQAKLDGPITLHIQWQFTPDIHYKKTDILINTHVTTEHASVCLCNTIANCLKSGKSVTSLGGTKTEYWMLDTSESDNLLYMKLPCGYVLHSIQKPQAMTDLTQTTLSPSQATEALEFFIENDKYYYNSFLELKSKQK